MLFKRGGEITIGKYCQIANNVIIVTTNHLLDKDLFYRNIKNKNVTIEDNVWMGSGAKIMLGITMGENAVVAAGAVVTKNVDKNTLVAGIPAKMIKKLEFNT